MKKLSYWLMFVGMRPFMSKWMPVWLQRVWSDLVGLVLLGPGRRHSNYVTIGGVETLEISPKNANS